MKWFNFAFGSLFLVAAAVFTAMKLGSFELNRLRSQVDELQREREQLVEYAQRLSSSRRVAQVDVLRQREDDAGHTVSTLVWQEIGRDGTLGRPVAVEAVGSLVYFEALVIKFAHHFIAEEDPLRGTSLALFRRIFGSRQSPDSVPELDRMAGPPVTEEIPGKALERELWAKFWQLIDNPEMADRYGVRVAQVEAPAVPVRSGQVWELALDAAGGLNIKRLAGRRP
jgi:hypothetical protein